MSDYQRRIEAADKELENAGIWQLDAKPPYFWVLRKLGLTPIPPHYNPLWRNFLGQTVFFTVIFGLASHAMLGGAEGRSIIEFGSRTILTGLAFGLFMLIYYAASRRKYTLSRWQDL